MILKPDNKSKTIVQTILKVENNIKNKYNQTKHYQTYKTKVILLKKVMKKSEV